MSTKGQPNTTTLRARQQAAVVTRVTGEWLCKSGMHYTRAPQEIYRGRPVCAPCQQRLKAINQRNKDRP